MEIKLFNHRVTCPSLVEHFVPAWVLKVTSGIPLTSDAPCQLSYMVGLLNALDENRGTSFMESGAYDSEAFALIPTDRDERTDRVLLMTDDDDVIDEFTAAWEYTQKALIVVISIRKYTGLHLYVGAVTNITPL